VTKLALVHFNGIPADVRPANLRVYCQLCHLDFWEVKDDPAFWPPVPWSQAEFERRVGSTPSLGELEGFLSGLELQRLALTGPMQDRLDGIRHRLTVIDLRAKAALAGGKKRGRPLKLR
jgi:hypothetical protein